MRRLALAAATLAGALVGTLVAVVVPNDGEKPARLPTPPTVAPRRAPVSDHVLLVWATHPTGDLAARLAGVAGITGLTDVAAGTVELSASHDADGRPVDTYRDGWRVSLDTIAVDAATFPAFVADAVAPLVTALRPGEALLGATSAGLRRLGVGATVELAGGAPVRVAGIVDDAYVGAAELVLARDDPNARALGTGYLLVRHGGDRAGVERTIRARLPAGAAVRFRAPGETPYLRRGDAVLPQSLVKARFGEFAHRPLGGRDIEQDPAWQGQHLVTATVPILGQVRCHRAIVGALRGALAEVERENLSHLVDPAGYAGCWTPRSIGPGEPLSRHAWGVALDVNHARNPTGVGSAQDARLVDVLARWGFTTGADWLVPDPAHIEYLRPPRP
jgi:hypothetical protein